MSAPNSEDARTSDARPAYPDTPRGDVTDELHGHTIADPYRWLEDRDDPATDHWLRKQSELFATVSREWPTTEHWHDRLEALLGSGTISPPVFRGEFVFFMRREPGQEHSVLYCVGPDGMQRALVDPMSLDASGLTTLDSWQPTKQGHRLAYQISEGG
ncbi:MAG: S9 family peptidase, partial [Actinobacteria bacterium]|nr:S9 family peptidase [Actinomycetota bacterium]